MHVLTMMALLRIIGVEAVGGLFLVAIILAVLVGLVSTVFWIVELVDVLRREFPEPNTKLVWVVVILFTHALGALIYYFVGKEQGRLPGSGGIV